MWNKWKASNLYRKLKEIRVNRAVYLSSIVILLSLAIILALTAATNRARRDQSDNASSLPTSPSVTTPKEETPTGGSPEELPVLGLPAEGKLLKEHSADVQVFSQTMQDFRVHLGVDIVTEPDAQVFAAADGSVAKIWEDPMMGWCVAIKHNADCMTIYKNLSKDLAEGLAEGMTVRRGQLIGKVGDTAMLEIAEEPHLHMEMTVKGLQVDPLEYFSASVLASLSEDTAFEKPSRSQTIWENKRKKTLPALTAGRAFFDFACIFRENRV